MSRILELAVLKTKALWGMIVSMTSRQSYTITNHVLASWIDHSRDLLHMINHFREEMPQPIVGVGHSMGAGQLLVP